MSGCYLQHAKDRIYSAKNVLYEQFIWLNYLFFSFHQEKQACVMKKEKEYVWKYSLSES